MKKFVFQCAPFVPFCEDWNNDIVRDIVYILYPERECMCKGYGKWSPECGRYGIFIRIIMAHCRISNWFEWSVSEDEFYLYLKLIESKVYWQGLKEDDQDHIRYVLIMIRILRTWIEGSNGKFSNFWVLFVDTSTKFISGLICSGKLCLLTPQNE